MTVYLNGEFVDEREARISVLDRGLLYGDGFFETIRIHNGEPFRWRSHAARIAKAIEVLRFSMNQDLRGLDQVLREASKRNGQPNGIARLQVTRGVGSRGYSPRGAGPPTMLVTMHSPALSPVKPWTLITARSVRLPPPNPMSPFKHSNRLVQILARIEADDQSANDALLLDHQGAVAETSAANIFWVRHGVVQTPPLETNALPGVTRALVIELCGSLGLRFSETMMMPEELVLADTVFLSLASYGIVPVERIDDTPFRSTTSVDALREAYERQLDRECPAHSFP